LSACSPVSAPSDSPSAPLGSDRIGPTAAIRSTLAPDPLPEVHTAILVVDKLNKPQWQLKAIIADWNKVELEQFYIVNQCVTTYGPCVTIESKTLPQKDYLGQLDFRSGPADMVITVVPNQTNIEAQATICHELGHVLGLGHISKKGITSCMSDWGNTTRPSNLDIYHVNHLGSWDYTRVWQSFDE